MSSLKKDAGAAGATRADLSGAFPERRAGAQARLELTPVLSDISNIEPQLGRTR